jgi:hypothetical protein
MDANSRQQVPLVDPAYIPVPVLGTSARAGKVAYISDNPDIIAYMVDELVARSGLSKAEIARRMGSTPGTLGQYIYGRRRRPSFSFVARLAAACGARIKVEWPTA